MTQKFLKLFLLVSCALPVQVEARGEHGQTKSAKRLACDKAALNLHKRNVGLDDATLADASSDQLDPDHVRRQLTSLQVAGPVFVRDEIDAGSLSVNGGASFGGSVSVDGTIFAETISGFINLNGSLMVNGTPVSSPTGGAALGQYAYYYQTGGQPGGSLNSSTPFVTFNETGAATSGITIATDGGAEGGSIISIAVGGIYKITYTVIAVLAGGATSLDFSLEQFTAPATVTPIAGTYFGLHQGGGTAGNNLEVVGQVILSVPTTVTAAAPYQMKLEGISVGGGSYVIDGAAAAGLSGASIAIEKIG